MKKRLHFILLRTVIQSIRSILVLLIIIQSGAFGSDNPITFSPATSTKNTLTRTRGHERIHATLPTTVRTDGYVLATGRSVLAKQPLLTILTQTSCGQNFDVLSSFTITNGAGTLARAVDANSISVKNQPANGRVRVNPNGTFNFTPTTSSAGTASFTLTGLPTSSSFVTTSGLSVDNSLCLCVYANSGTSNITSAITTDFATISQTGLGAETTIKAVLSGTATAGDRAGFTIGSDALISAGLAQSYTINTYLGSSTTVRNTQTFSSLLGIQLLSGSVGEISIPTTQSYDRVELVITALVGFNASTDVYYGFSRPAPISQAITINFPANVCTDVISQTSCAQSFSILANDIPLGSGVLDPSTVTIPTQPGNGVVSVNPDGTVRFMPNTQSAGTATFSYSVCTTTGPSPTTLVTTAGTSASGILGICVLCSVSGSDNVGDASLTNAATISLPIGVDGVGFVRAKLNGVARAGDIAGFVVGNNNLLTVSLLNSFTVTTYRNGEIVESGDGGSLLNLQLLSGGKYEINFQTSHDFDEIEFRTGAFASVLNTSQVYYGFSRFGQTCYSYTAQINFPANVCPPFTFDCGSAAISGTFIANNTAGQAGTLTIPFSTPITAAQVGKTTFSLSGTGFVSSPSPFTTTLTNSQTSVVIPITYNGTGATGTRTLLISSPLATASCSATVAVIATPTSPALLVLTPVNNTTVTTTPTFSGTATPGSLITIAGLGGPSLGVGVTVADLITGAFSTNLVLPLAQGPQTLTVIAANPFNPGLIVTQPVTVTVVASPALLVLTPVNNTTVTATPTFSGTATPGSLITIAGLSGPSLGVGVTIADLVTGAFSTNLILPLAQGPQTLTVIAANPFNPGLLVTQPVTVTVVASPLLTVLTPVNNTTVTATPTFSGTATPGSLITIAGLGGPSLGVGVTIADLVTGAFSTNLLLPLAQGPQTLTVIAANPFNPGLLVTQPVTVTVVASPALLVLTPVNNTTVTTTPTFSGTATPGSLITIAGLGGPSLGVGVTIADLVTGAFSTNLVLPLAQGPQTLTVIAANPFNPGLLVTQPVTVTVVASPLLTVLTPVNNTTVTATPTFSGTATPGSLITIAGLSGPSLGVGVTVADLITGAFSTNLVLPLAQGPQTLTVIAANPFNPGLIVTQPVTVTVVASPALLVLTPVNNTTVTTTPTFSGTATPGSLITIAGLSGPSLGVGVTIADLVTGAFSTNLLLPLAQGPQTLTVIAANPFNPGLIVTQPVTVTVVASPLLTVLTPVNNTTVTTTPTFSGTATPGSLITITGLGGPSLGVGVTVADLLTGAFSTNLVLPLAQGPQTLTVIAANPFNPGLIVTQPVTVTVVASPALLVLTPVNNTTVTATPTFSGTATPGSLITIAGLSGPSLGVGVTVADLITGAFSTNLVLPLAQGPQTLTVIAANPFNPGLIVTQPVTVTVVASPLLTVLTPVNNTTVTTTPTFSGTATPGSLITIAGLGGPSLGVGVTVADLLTGAFSTNLLLPLAQGPQTLTVIAANPFNPGLIVTQPVTVTVVASPLLTVLTPVNNTTVTTTPTFSGTATPGSLITIAGLGGPSLGVGVTIADLVTGAFSTNLLLPLAQGPQTLTVIAANPFNPGLIATQPVTVTVVGGSTPLFTFNCGTATVTGPFIANGVGGQTGTLTLPILNALAGPVSLTIGGTNFGTPTGLFATTLTLGQTSISIPLTYNGNGLAGLQTISIVSNQGADACSVSVPVSGPVGSLTFTQTACAESFSVLSSFTAVGSGAIDPTTVQVINQPANGTVRVNANGTINFQPTSSSAGTATFTIAAASTLTNAVTQQFVTTTDLAVSNNLTCQPIVNLCPITDPANITSASLTDFAHLEQTALLGTTTIKATLNGTGQAGDLAGFVIANPTLLSVAVLPTYTINTYLGTNMTVRDSKTFSSLLAIQLLSGGLQELSFQTTQSFDRVELVVRTAASVLLTNDIYYGFSKPATVYTQKVVTINYGADICTDVFSQTACAQSFTVLANQLAPGSGVFVPTTVTIPTQPANGTVTVNANGTLSFTPATPASGTAVFSYSVCTKDNSVAIINNTTNGTTQAGINGICLLCSVTSETAVGDADLTNSADISIPVGVAGSGFVRAKLNQMASAGDYAGFVISNSTILSVGFLNSVTVITYKGGLPQEQVSGGSLLSLQLLSGSKYEVKFQTKKEFDELQLNVGALASVLSNTQVYYGFSKFGQVCGSHNVRLVFPANICTTPPTIAILSPVNNATVTTTPTISGTATPNSTVVISTPGNATACQTTASASGTYACGITLAVGIQSVTAVATNENGTSVPATVTVVVVAPANPDYSLNVKVLLQGPLLNVPGNVALMNDNIRTGGYLPTTTPYSATLSSRFTQIGGGGGETTTPTVLSANAGTQNAIVDWVLVELRDAANPATIVATRSGLVQRDGDVVLPADGTSPLSFSGLSGSQYYVSVKHRNHLGAMTATSVVLSVTGTTVDFTTLSDAQVYDKAGPVSYDGFEMVTINGKRALWAGDVNADGKVKYIGLASDNTLILNNVISTQGVSPNPLYNYDFAFGYFAGDVDMNAKVKYQGTSNDSSVIFNNVIATYTLNGSHLYNYDFFIEQLP